MSNPNHLEAEKKPVKNGLEQQQQLMVNAASVGALSGVSGLVIGPFIGIFRSTRPVIFTLALGIQWFAMGTTFWASRGFLLQALNREETSPRDRIYASSFAGTVTGASAGAILRGRANVIPGAIMFGLSGLLGQTVFNVIDVEKVAQAEEEPQFGADSQKPLWYRIAASRWSPLKAVPDVEYEEILKRKISSIDGEISILDDDIERLRAEKK